MRSSVLVRHARLRRWLPWALWVLAACIAVPMGMSQAGIGSSPALIETRAAALSPIRTEHRLRIRKILVRPDQRVKAGDVLVQMDTAEIDAELAVAHAKLVYAQAIAGWRQIRLQDDRARTAHALASTAEQAAVVAARTVTVAERDRSELAQLDINLELEEKLVDSQLASADRLRSMRLRRAALAKKVEAYKATVARARRSAAGASERLGRWRHDPSGVVAAPGDASSAPDIELLSEVDARVAAGEVQRREIAHLDLLRDQHQIRAPFDGRVGEILAHEGELSADPSAPIITVVEEASSAAVAYVPQSKANQIHLGDVVKLMPRDRAGPPHTGRVIALGPGITEIPERFRRVPRLREYGRNVYIRLDAPATLPGMACDAVFRRGQEVGR